MGHIKVECSKDRDHNLKESSGVPTQERAGTAADCSKIAMNCTKQWCELDGKSGEARSRLTAEMRMMNWA